MLHILKIWPEYFKAVKDGTKTFEYRNNDRKFAFGDYVLLEEWDPSRDFVDSSLKQLKDPKGYTGRWLVFKIGYILPVENNFVIFSLIP